MFAHLGFTHRVLTWKQTKAHIRLYLELILNIKDIKNDANQNRVCTRWYIVYVGWNANELYETQISHNKWTVIYIWLNISNTNRCMSQSLFWAGVETKDFSKLHYITLISLFF